MLHRNWHLKLAAAALAIFIWFWVIITEHGLRRGVEFRVRTSGLSMVAARTVPVVLQTRGALPPDVKMISVQLVPPMVTVVGSSLRVNQVKMIRTAILDLSRVVGSFEQDLPLIRPSGIQVPNTETVKVTVQVTVATPLATLPAQAPGPKGAQPVR